MTRGVVIWYSQSEFKALIWCEDSGSLAVATGATAWRNPMVHVAVGDFVAFTARSAGQERRCHDIHVIAPQVAPELPNAIRPAHQSHRQGNPPLHLCYSRD